MIERSWGHVFDQVHVMLGRATNSFLTLAEVAAAVEDGAIVDDPAGRSEWPASGSHWVTPPGWSRRPTRRSESPRSSAIPPSDSSLGWLLYHRSCSWDGRLDDVEPLAAQARALHDQLGFWGGAELYGFNLILVRREQGRLDEIAQLDHMLRRSTYPSVTKVRGLFALERGDLERGQRPAGRRQRRPDSPGARLHLADRDGAAGGAGRGRRPALRRGGLRVVLPSSDQVVTMSAYACLGAVSHYLGLLGRRAWGGPATPRARLEEAVALNDRIGAVPWGVRSRYELARVVEPVDQQRAYRLLSPMHPRGRGHQWPGG